MLTFVLKLSAKIATLACVLLFAEQPGQQNPTRTILLEVVRNSWDTQRDETLIYLCVYSDGFAGAHPMRKVDFRNIEFKKKQLSGEQLVALRNLLADPATAQLRSEYSRYWGNKDFGYKFDITISAPSGKRTIKLENFQPFLARKQHKPYPQQLEKLGCAVWKLRAQVSGEPLEKDWLTGCTELGY